MHNYQLIQKGDFAPKERVLRVMGWLSRSRNIDGLKAVKTIWDLSRKFSGNPNSTAISIIGTCSSGKGDYVNGQWNARHPCQWIAETGDFCITETREVIKYIEPNGMEDYVEPFSFYRNKPSNNVNIIRYSCNGFWYNTCKVGNMSSANSLFYPFPMSEFNKCESCGKLGNPHYITYRADIFGWDHIRDKTGNTDRYQPSKTTVCMACWNKIKPIMKVINEAGELKRLGGKIKRESAKWRKSQQQTI